MNLSLGFSPCPNDTFTFHALVHGLVTSPGLSFTPRLEDVETLNRLATGGLLDVSKVSYGALPALLPEYAPLASGGALGRGCGPLLVAREPTPLEELEEARIAIPGVHTTANLLLRLYRPELPAGIEKPYHQIMPAVAAGQADAGLIIHESRFTYRRHGLVRLADLGEWWEGETGLPIPLGAVVARRSLGAEGLKRVEGLISRSVAHARHNPRDSRDYVRRHSRELDEGVIRSHINLYVNDFSLALGSEGERAVQELIKRAQEVAF
ncbi:MAG: 1,4-dihydroxy-6-naphthoate synthase [Longimicrobiaceae bacterium]